MNPLFKRTGSLRPGRSVFDLSHEVKLTCDMGQIIPILNEEMIPGDTFKVGNQIVARMQPMIAPIMHQVDISVHYFFVPYRLLWSGWEDFITGGKDGTDSSLLPTMTSAATIGSLKDYLGFPIGITWAANEGPCLFPLYAYNQIWNEYYRDENLQTEVAVSNGNILNRAWEKDYFTSSLPWQQRGTPVALPISGLTSAEWDDTDFVDNGASITANVQVSNSSEKLVTTNDTQRDNLAGFFQNNEVDLSNATTFDVVDLRLAFQIQKFMERNARAGVRYTEFLGAHFGVSPRDERLQRPEYIGGSKSRMIISEVLQTASTDEESPQGNMAGHGISADQTFCGSYTAQEFGVIMGLMSIMPKPAYSQGINRQWLRRTRYDFPFPEFVNLSEQAVLCQEIYATGTKAQDDTIFGYQGRYDELRYKPNRIAGLMRTSFNFWHLGREFSTAPELNDTFIKCVPSKRIFAVDTEPGLLVSVGNIIKAIRPIPIMGNPGFIDHN